MNDHAMNDQDDYAQLAAIQQQLIQARVTRNRSSLERLLASDWVVTHTDGRMSSRSDVLRDFDSGTNRLLEGSVDELKIRTYGDFAIVNGRTRARGEYKGHAYDVKLRFTDVFVRQNGLWQAAASHASRIATEDSKEEAKG